MARTPASPRVLDVSLATLPDAGTAVRLQLSAPLRSPEHGVGQPGRRGPPLGLRAAGGRSGAADLPGDHVGRRRGPPAPGRGTYLTEPVISDGYAAGPNGGRRSTTGRFPPLRADDHAPKCFSAQLSAPMYRL